MTNINTLVGKFERYRNLISAPQCKIWDLPKALEAWGIRKDFAKVTLDSIIHLLDF